MQERIKEEYRGVTYIIEPLPYLAPELRQQFIKMARKDTRWAIDQAIAGSLVRRLLDKDVFIHRDEIISKLQTLGNWQTTPDAIGQ